MKFFAHNVFIVVFLGFSPAVFQAVAAPMVDGHIVVLDSKTVINTVAADMSRVDRLKAVHSQLKSHANRSQQNIVSYLDARAIEYRPYWIVNAVFIRASQAQVDQIRKMPGVADVIANKRYRNRLPEPVSSSQSRGVPQWNIAMIGADRVWALENTGQSIVVGTADTGVFYQHPAIHSRYRGFVATEDPHDFNWFDAACDVNDCGSPLAEPADPHGHGTSTLGLIVAGLPGEELGVAPGAQWIACRNMDELGIGSLDSYLRCFEWFLAPTRTDGSDADPSRAPHVISNSWSCPVSEGCDAGQIDLLEDAVDVTLAAGIVVVAAASNAGSSCGSIQTPPAILSGSMAVGSVGMNSVISSFSGRGPVVSGGETLLKPQLVAPGSGVRTTDALGDYSSRSGTSAAAPHVAGTIALVLAQNPQLIGDTTSVDHLLAVTADPKTSDQGCGGLGPTAIPNHVYGHGIVDAYQAVIMADTVFYADFD